MITMHSADIPIMHKVPLFTPTSTVNAVHYSRLPNAELQIKPYARVQPTHICSV